MALAAAQAFVTGRRRVRTALAVLPALIALGLAGCGQKGPLVLPPSAAASAPAASGSPAAPVR